EHPQGAGPPLAARSAQGVPEGVAAPGAGRYPRFGRGAALLSRAPAALNWRPAMAMDPVLPAERVRDLLAAGWWRDRHLHDSFAEAVAAVPERIAVVDYRTETGERHALTYRQLDDRVGRIAAGLKAVGVAAGEVVSFQLPNWWEFVAIHLACLRLGAVSNPLMPIFRERELGFMVDFAESRVLIVPAQFRGCDHQALIA